MPVFNLSNITSKFRAVAFFVTVNAERHTQYTCICSRSVSVPFSHAIGTTSGRNMCWTCSSTLSSSLLLDGFELSAWRSEMALFPSGWGCVGRRAVWSHWIGKIVLPLQDIRTRFVGCIARNVVYRRSYTCSSFAEGPFIWRLRKLMFQNLTRLVVEISCILTSKTEITVFFNVFCTACSCSYIWCHPCWT